MNEDFYIDAYPQLTELDAQYPCPDLDCDGVVTYERETGHWQCSECSFRQKHIPNDIATLMGFRL